MTTRLNGNNGKAQGDGRNKIAVVTGGSSGIGLELCRLLRGTHATYSLDVNPPQKRINDVPDIDCNVMSASSVERALERIGGPIDLLVNNAGILRQGSITDIPVSSLQELVMTNIFGSLLVVREAWRKLSPDATILQMSSERAIYPADRVGVYGLTKHLVMETALLIKQSNPGKTVKVALPGPVDTPLLRYGLGKERCEAIRDATITPRQMARFLIQLLHSDYDLLRFDDARETASCGTGKYVLENFDGPRNAVILGGTGSGTIEIKSLIANA